MKVIDISRLGNDLFAEFNCECTQNKYADDPVLSKIFKTKIKLTGYNDSYFFDTVNKEPRTTKCDCCGKEWQYQWARGGVIIFNLETNLVES